MFRGLSDSDGSGLWVDNALQVVSRCEGDVFRVDVFEERVVVVEQVKSIEYPLWVAVQGVGHAVDAVGIGFYDVGQLAGFFDW